jgi:hypothetical protein
MAEVFLHPCADERATCPRLDGHYVPNRCLKIYLALRSQVDWASYDRLVVDGLHHTRHERKLRELREINREYTAAGRPAWDLVLTRKARGAHHVEFRLNCEPRWIPGQQAVLFATTSTRMGEADILTILGV